MSTRTRSSFTLQTPTRQRAAEPPASAHHERRDSGEAFLHDPTAARPQMHSEDALAEILGEDYVASATSGEETSPATVDEVDIGVVDEVGDPPGVFSIDVAPPTARARQRRV